MSALDFLKAWPFKPWNPAKRDGKWSTSDLMRACEGGTITMNGERVSSREGVGMIHSLVFFPSSNRRTTFDAPAGEFWA